jgi:hypothetical protein
MNDVLGSNIDRVGERTGKWAEDEDIKLKDAVELRSRKNWAAITGLVRELSAGSDGSMSWVPTSTGRIGVRVNG